ncbi:unnamed protein product [Boreogadus saida]
MTRARMRHKKQTENLVCPCSKQTDACKLTMDPNTANKRLTLSKANRKVTEVEEKQSYADHPEELDSYCQVLCREVLTGRCYWEHNLSSGSNRVGVYLDRPAGTLSFYRVSSDTLTHIHTFQCTFNQEDLLPGFDFELRGSGSTVSLCRL